MKHLTLVIAMLGVMLAQAQVADDIYGDNVDLTIVTPAKQDKDTKKAEKEHKKLMKQRVDSLGHAKAAAALERGYWVIVADRINVGNMGYTVSGLNTNTNFVFQQAQEGMVQFAFNHGGPSMNGLGGMTLEGKVSNVKSNTDKKGNILYSYSIMSTDINAQITVTVFAGTDYAEALVQPTFSGPRMTLQGRLVPYIRPRKD